MALTSEIMRNDVTMEKSQAVMHNFAEKEQKQLGKKFDTPFIAVDISSILSAIMPTLELSCNLILECMIRIFCVCLLGNRCCTMYQQNELRRQSTRVWCR